LCSKAEFGKVRSRFQKVVGQKNRVWRGIWKNVTISK